MGNYIVTCKEQCHKRLSEFVTIVYKPKYATGFVIVETDRPRILNHIKGVTEWRDSCDGTFLLNNVG